MMELLYDRVSDMWPGESKAADSKARGSKLILTIQAEDDHEFASRSIRINQSAHDH